MNKIIQGDSLEKLKDLEDNSIDSIVTDPPYELGFMGKSWDSTGIANNVDMWKECLRVLKPGGHLLAFSGTRTYHRMASAIEDAGFEVRDMIEWVYGSGFPKSLNIGKAVDKLQGNDREVVGKTQSVQFQEKGYEYKGDKKGSGFNNEKYWGFGNDVTKGTSEWEGWGTALKPAHEPICMARKPLGQQELDIAKNICYNITEKGLINNSEIIWRIKNVKSAEKQKTKEISSSTELPKTVVVSAETVKMNENESVGKKIQKLIDSICESGIQETGNKPEKQVLKAISKTKIEYQDTGENINTNEKQKLLKPTEESASVVENQDLSSLPLTILEVAEDSTEKKSKTETFMYSLKSTDTQKTDTDCYAQTATSQWVCMDIVRTLKISFEGKEYDFIELSDGSLVWNEALEPYRKQQKLNVAKNCLKWGTGGINIDESRVEYNDGTTAEDIKRKYTGNNENNGSVTNNFGVKEIKMTSESTLLGRFPANLILSADENGNVHEEVKECFPETKPSKQNRHSDNRKNVGNSMFIDGVHNSENSYTDSGSASRFFKSIIYQAKASKSDRAANGTITNNHPTVKPIALMEYLIKMVTPKGGIVLDPFAGSGSTLVAAKQNGYQYIGIELTEEYIPIIEARLTNLDK